jgi:putative DNA primase/helicase
MNSTDITEQGMEYAQHHFTYVAPGELNEGHQVEMEEQKQMPRVIDHKSVLASLLSDVKPIDFHEEAELPAGEQLTAKHYKIISIEILLEIAKKKNWSLSMRAGLVYVFNGAFWKQLEESELLHFLGKAAEKLGVNAYEARYHVFRTDLHKQFFTSAYQSMPDRNKDEVLINLLNGTFVIKPDKQYLRDFDRRDFLTYQLPFMYDKGAKAEMFLAFLQTVLPDPTQQMVLAEFVAYVFINSSTLKLEKSLILYGSGANGKSVFFAVIIALLGRENVSNYSLQSLTNDSGYYRAQLTNKLLNYAPEISPHMNSTIFKQLVSGEPIEARFHRGSHL